MDVLKLVIHLLLIFKEIILKEELFLIIHILIGILFQIPEIVIVDTNSGWNGKGSMPEISLTLTNLAQGCKFLTNNKTIIYGEWRSPSEYFNYY